MSGVDFSLADRLTAVDSTIAMSGVQAIVRVALDQHLADAAAGLRTAGLICGYRGSPLGGIDQAYERDRAVLEANDIRFVNGVNEDLAATVVWGSQLASLQEGRRYDGVIGMWYGKGPGVDRSGDAFRHGNFSGVDPHGGVLVVAGDDPANKSSTIPSASEWSLADVAIPVLFPGNVQEVLDFGRYGYEMSRFSGVWVGLKIQTNVADSYATVNPDPRRLHFARVGYDIDGRAWSSSHEQSLVGPTALGLEDEAFGSRLRAAETFVAAQGLDRCLGAPINRPARSGIVAAGTTYYDTREALRRLGFATDDELATQQIRVYKPAMIWPLEPTGLRQFAHGLEEILVIEEKRSFIERQVRDVLYGAHNAPRVVGKRDPDGKALLPHSGSLSADLIESPLRSRIAHVIPDAGLLREKVRIAVSVGVAETDEIPSRGAYFCSGCPHNRSTVLPDGSIGGGGIGCHGMALSMTRSVVGLTHMGGEGSQWVGMSPFLNDRHRFQNLGDGTFAHSGSLAIRQAIAAGVNITYKILYNGTVAMTGGQDAAGQLGVPALTRWLEAEGVVKTVVVAAEPDSYPRRSLWAANSRVAHRDALDAVQRELREVTGVTCLIYDQACAAELRRDRKRGRAATPTTRVMIVESICEGCGDCGVVSNCASVHPVETPYGRKTQIHQDSCNFDLTCVSGNCPAFVTVEIDPDRRPAKRSTSLPLGETPPDPVIPDFANVVLVGIGGTGVVTMSQVIATAALMDGKQATTLDQTGLSQKGGTVVSNLVIARDVSESTNLVGAGEADAYILFDLVSGVDPKVLSRASSNRTTAVTSTALIPTGTMVSGRGRELFPDLDAFRVILEDRTHADANVWIDAAGVARAAFGSEACANVILVGAAYQRGLLPVSATGLERAIELNGVAVETNLAAFRLGRRIVADPEVLDGFDFMSRMGSQPPMLTPAADQLIASLDPDEDLAEVLAWRVPELIEWGSFADARRFVDVLERVRRAERDVEAGSTALSRAVAAQLFHLMAYKDEYEVARLALRAEVDDVAAMRFGPGARARHQLKPPTLKAFGFDRKIAVPRRIAKPMFSTLVRMKPLRGRWCDPFGRSPERRLERVLVGEYIVLVDGLLDKLTPDNYEQAVAIADLAGQIRGYDSVKLASVERYRSALMKALSTW